ncbi:MFS transporter [Streptomyces canus]|uniref:MFS transporter n=1 Tax=Streptomyces canus TaxID=58343 RepID=UPI0033E57C76
MTSLDPAATPDLRRRELAGAVRATYAVFACLGLAGATWASRLPQISARLDLDPASLGLMLLMMAVGGVAVLPLAGAAVTRLGPRRAVTVVAVLVAVALGALALGYVLWAPLMAGGLVLLGTATGFWDVAVTVHAAAVERRLGRSLMPRFFAGFSLGTVAGACLGVLMSAWRFPVSLHIGGIAVLIALVTPAATRRFLSEPAPAPGDSPAPQPAAGRPGPSPWRDPRTVVIGLIALAFAMAEGAGSNWISLTVIDRHHTSATVGTLAYATFLSSVTLGRSLGSVIVDRVGRPGALRAAAVATVIGVVLFALGPSPWTTFAGALLWGTGAALGFPIALSAGADEPVHATGRVSVITSIGYCGFVGGPPLIGFLAGRIALAPALLVVAVFMAGSVPLARAARPTPLIPRATADNVIPVAPSPEHIKENPRAKQSAHDRGQ